MAVVGDGVVIIGLVRVVVLLVVALVVELLLEGVIICIPSAARVR